MFVFLTSLKTYSYEKIDNLISIEPGQKDYNFSFSSDYKNIFIEKKDGAIHYFGLIDKKTTLEGYIYPEGDGIELIIVKKKSSINSKIIKYKTTLTKEHFKSDYFTKCSVEHLDRKRIA